MIYLGLKSENRMDDDMAEDNIRQAAARRQRIQMLKKCIILTMVTIVLLPVALCFILLDRVQRLDKSLDSLTVQVETLKNTVEEQREQLEELTSGLMTAGDGSARAGIEESGPTEQELIPPQDIASEGTGESHETDTAREANASNETGQTEDSGEYQEPEGPEAAAVHKVYLTFDDGPSKYTDDILDILDRYDVKATFFVVGKDSDSAREAMQEIAARGHTLGMHSYSHKYKEIYNSLEDFIEDYEKIWDYLYEVTGVESRVYRFPGGSSNSVSDIDMQEFADYLDTQGVRFFDWNISSGDGGKTLLSVKTLVKNSTEDIEKFGTSVILMHDSAAKSTTVDALPAIIETILALEDTVILPITEETELVQHIQHQAEMPGD